MKLILALVVLVFVAFSILADYKWKQWIKTRQQARDHHGDHHNDGQSSSR